MQTSRGILGSTIAVTAALVLSAHLAGAQGREAVVSKDAISVHRVERGAMKLRESARGVISSITPARVTVGLTLAQGAAVQVGQACSAQIVAPAVLRCRVAKIERDTLRGLTTAELELTAPLPPGTAVDDGVGTLIDVGTVENVVYFARPASARPGTASTIFVLEPDGEHARRVPVVYGRLSGSQLEIVRGLAAGDRVIVTDLPDFAVVDRIALR